MLEFNDWVKANAELTEPPMTLIDTSDTGPDEVADAGRGTGSPLRLLDPLTSPIFTYRIVFAMRDVLYLEQIEQAETLLKPQRIDVLRQLAEPRSCTEVASRLDQTPQRVYYHVKRLVGAGLAAQVAERRVRGISEGIYQAERPLVLALAARWSGPSGCGGSGTS